ncbi:MAG: glutathione S-transferase family protein [Candidatus Omnitrophica bacterium]|nr:glutathione S-transferase family protein [Candidatus Omnitrophota bacterium]MDE2214575.1 glutathione S-transferase family protein [Candidatus Omnitrophota bacterium]MDE2231652.1 glutathione S-transferase family protein [Candidatus Omnitrophota bacterium]
MLTIYGSDLSGPAIKARLTASFLGLDYTWRHLNLREREQKSEWFLKINPVGKVPAMDDDGFYLFESNAICKYLCDKHGSSLYPKDTKARALVDQWIDYATLHIGANFIPVVFNRLFAPLRGLPVNDKAITDGLEFLKQYFPVIENQLARHEYIVADEISLADIVLMALLEPAEMARIDLSAYPKLTAWRAGLKKRSFYTSCYKEYGEMLKASLKAGAQAPATH